MNGPLPTLRNSQVALLEVFALLAALTSYTAAMLLGISVDAQIYATVALLCSLLVLCWRNSGGGMHPCFLFLGLLLLFQGGRLLAFCMDPSQVAPLRLESSNGLFDPAIRVQRLTLLTIVVSAVFVYVPVRIAGAKLVYAPPPSAQLTPYLLSVFFLTLPFLIWKNYQYLSFVNSHGGYIAIYLDHDGLVAQAGTLVRILSRLCATSFLVYFVYERPGRRLFLIAAIFFSVSVMELLVGLRGDVMLTGIGCIFLWKLKRGTHFTPRSLVFLALCLALVSELLAGTREHRETGIVLTEAPRMFLFQQGTSISVPEALIGNIRHFERYSLTYLRNSPLAATVPITEIDQGKLFERDLSLYLDPIAMAAGYSLGGSYLADGYLRGGLAGLVFISLLISSLLVLLARFLTGYSTPFALAIILCLVYVPRSSLILELILSFEICLFMSIVIAGALGIRKIAQTYAVRICP